MGYSYSTCCVVNCKNNGKNSQCKFYRFPMAKHWLPQREKWITAVKRINPDGSSWEPKKHHLICSAHFIGNKKSQHPLNPSFVPTIFPSGYRQRAKYKTNEVNSNNDILSLSTVVKTEPQDTDAQIQINTDNNSMTFEYIKIEPQSLNESAKAIQKQFNAENYKINDNFGTVNNSPKYADKACQVHIFIDGLKPEKTFICNRYISNNSNNVEIQTDITETSHIIIIPNQKKFKSKICGTLQKSYVDRLVGPDIRDNIHQKDHFTGFSSIKKDEQMLDLAGVNFCNFNFLLQKITKNPDNCKISKENRLLIYLVKKKTGLSFSALSVLFCVHRTTISRIYKFTFEELTSDASNVNSWPNELKHLVHNKIESESQDNNFKKRKLK